MDLCQNYRERMDAETTSIPWTVSTAPLSCNGPPLDCCNGPSLWAATFHPVDRCNGLSELQRSTPWTDEHPFHHILNNCVRTLQVNLIRETTEFYPKLYDALQFKMKTIQSQNTTQYTYLIPVDKQTWLDSWPADHRIFICNRMQSHWITTHDYSIYLKVDHVTNFAIRQNKFRHNQICDRLLWAYHHSIPRVDRSEKFRLLKAQFSPTNEAFINVPAQFNF